MKVTHLSKLKKHLTSKAYGNNFLLFVNDQNLETNQNKGLSCVTHRMVLNSSPMYNLRFRIHDSS